jgi:hypothetical protein
MVILLKNKLKIETKNKIKNQRRINNGCLIFSNASFSSLKVSSY